MWSLNPIFGNGPGSFFEYYLDFVQNDKLSINLKYREFLLSSIAIFFIVI